MWRRLAVIVVACAAQQPTPPASAPSQAPETAEAATVPGPAPSASNSAPLPAEAASNSAAPLPAAQPAAPSSAASGAAGPAAVPAPPASSSGSSQAAQVDKPPFTYSDQSTWSKLSGTQCGSTSEQSPVSIVTASVVPTAPQKLTTSASASTMGQISWTYQSTTVNAALLATSRGWQAHLSSPDDTTTLLNFFGKHYQLKRVEFTSPSENQLDGKSYDMEMQYVHEETGAGNLLVSSVFLEVGLVENNSFLNAFWTKFPAKIGAESQAQISNPYSAGLPSDRTLYAFNGSETIPPCKSGVVWTVFKEPIVISRLQRDAYRGALNASSPASSNFLRFAAQPTGVAQPWNIDLGMNTRLVQTYTNRKIFSFPMLNPPPPPSNGGNGRLWGYVGLGAAGLAVLIGILVTLCVLCRRGSGDDEDEDDSLLQEKVPSREGGWSSGGGMAAPAGMRSAGYHQVPGQGQVTQQQLQSMALPQTQQLNQQFSGWQAPMTQWNLQR